MNQLSLISKSRENIAHNRFIDELMQYKDNQQLSPMVRQQLNYLFAHYGSGERSTVELISIMANNKLYDFKGDKMDNVDATNPTLEKQLQTVIESIDRSIVGNLESSTIEGNIAAYRSGMSKRSEVELYDNVSKQSVIQKYHLSEDMDFTVSNRDNIIKELKIENTEAEGEFISYKDMSVRDQFEALMLSLIHI